MITLELKDHKVYTQIGSKNEAFWREKGYKTAEELAAKPARKTRTKKPAEVDDE